DVDNDDGDNDDVIEFSGTLRQVYTHLEEYAHLEGSGVEGETISVLLDKLATRVEKEEANEKAGKGKKVVHLHRRKESPNPRKNGARKYERNGARNEARNGARNGARKGARNGVRKGARDGAQKGGRDGARSSSLDLAKAEEIMKHIDGPGRVKFGGGGGTCIINGRPCDDD
ncbi:unnamed protein product, partial [Laminaria digitata]